MIEGLSEGLVDGLPETLGYSDGMKVGTRNSVELG